MINVLLLGQKGLAMLHDAQNMAAQALQTQNYENHPDYMFIDLPKGKKSLGVEDILPVVQKGYIRPVLADKTVVIINHMDCLTEAAQNKLLLSLESNANLYIIGIAYKDVLLKTVMSRMRIVRYKPCTMQDFVSLYNGTYTKEEAVLLYYATQGCSGIVPTLADYLQMFTDLYRICQGNDLKEIMNTLYLVKEKDPLNICNDRQLMLATIRVLLYSFTDKAQHIFQDENNAVRVMKLVDVIDMLLADEAACQTPVYTKDNFFRMIASLTEKGGCNYEKM